MENRMRTSYPHTPRRRPFASGSSWQAAARSPVATHRPVEQAGRNEYPDEEEVGTVSCGSTLRQTAQQSRLVKRLTTKQAAIFDERTLDELVARLKLHSLIPESEICMLLLSRLAALRAAEIAGLRVQSVTDATGTVLKYIRVMPSTAKGGKGRDVPMHPMLRRAFQQFLAVYPHASHIALSPVDGKTPRSVNAVTLFFHRLYKRAGLIGCSSHSGRRSCLTEMSRIAHFAGAGIRDIQLIAGHARMSTTERYFEPSQNAEALMKLVCSGKPLTPSTTKETE
jgi:integrase